MANTPTPELAKHLEAELNKLVPHLKPTAKFAAELEHAGPMIAARLKAGVSGAEIAAAVKSVYNYKVSPERLVRLVRPWTKDHAAQHADSNASSASADRVNGGDQ